MLNPCPGWSTRISCLLILKHFKCQILNGGSTVSGSSLLLRGRETVQAVLVSLEDELGLLDQRFGELLATAQNPDCSSWPNPEVRLEEWEGEMRGEVSGSWVHSCAALGTAVNNLCMAAEHHLSYLD